MAQKRGNNVKIPAQDKPDSKGDIRHFDNLTDQHHGENTKAPQEDRKIGQHNQAGRPPLMKK